MIYIVKKIKLTVLVWSQLNTFVIHGFLILWFLIILCAPMKNCIIYIIYYTNILIFDLWVVYLRTGKKKLSKMILLCFIGAPSNKERIPGLEAGEVEVALRIPGQPVHRARPDIVEPVIRTIYAIYISTPPHHSQIFFSFKMSPSFFSIVFSVHYGWAWNWKHILLLSRLQYQATIYWSTCMLIAQVPTERNIIAIVI